MKYRIRDGHRLGHHGEVLVGGDVVDLPEDIATDPSVEGHVEPHVRVAVPIVVPPAPSRVPPVKSTQQKES